MIKLNELRLGNYVKNPVHGICRITELKSWRSEVGVTPLSFKNYVFSRIKIEPIELTDVILQKCGAEKFPTGKKDYSLHGVLLSHAECRDIYTHNGKELLYLHALQNYIFALTGEELTFKP